MNKREILKRRNDIARLLQLTDKMHRNCVRINTANSLEHELEKVRQCYRLKKEGKEFYTEARFMYCEGRADILVLDDRTVIEILNGETEEKCREKFRKGYPSCLTLEMVKVDAGDEK